jgi:tetratricopeptide (TPR) repeat protein
MKKSILKRLFAWIFAWIFACCAALPVLAQSPSPAEVAFEQGNEAFWVGHYTNALLQYNKAIAADTSKAIYFLHRANTYFQMQKYPQAIADYNKAIALDPYNGKAFNMRGRSRYLLKDFDGAVQDYDRARELEKKKGPNSLAAWGHAKQGTVDQACFNWIMQLKQGYDNAFDVKAMQEWGHQAEQSDSLNADARLLVQELLGMTYFEQEDYDRALLHLGKAERLIGALPIGSVYLSKYLEELDFNLYYVYAGILLHRQQYGEAISIFEKVAQWDAKNPLPFYAMSQAHFFQGHPDKALGLLREALQRGFEWGQIQLTPTYYEGLRENPDFHKLAEEFAGGE